MYLLIDNYDSFTYNLYQAFAECGVEVAVRRNDEITLDEIAVMAPEKIIISPGPGTPRTAGISKSVITRFMETLPILGICLGSQCIGEALGGGVIRVERIVHGLTTPVHHTGTELFKGVENPFPAARYHSLISSNLPEELEITAVTEGDLPMALEHRKFPLKGLQFHPESFLTGEGEKIIRNFIEL